MHNLRTDKEKSMSVRQKPMTIMVIDGLAERIHMALMTGATAAAMGRPVIYFFSKSAAKALTNPGWVKMPYGEKSAVEMDITLNSKGIADTELLLDALAALDVTFIVCETALQEHDIEIEDLITRPKVEISGLADLIEKGTGGDWLTF
jgi:peroxiredoxin family protein